MVHVVKEERSDGGERTGDQNPSTRTPGVTKVDDEQPDHYYGCPARRTVVLKVVKVLGEDDGDDKVRKGHAEGSDGEDGFAAEFVDVEDCGDGGDEHDDADDAGCEEGLRGSY
jgi:hypothetical protein